MRYLADGGGDGAEKWLSDDATPDSADEDLVEFLVDETWGARAWTRRRRILTSVTATPPGTLWAFPA